VSLVVGIDCSTTACKAIAWRADGTPVAEGRAKIALHNPEPDGWQQDAEEWWSALCGACQALCSKIDPSEVKALCVTNQRETFVVTDASGKPLHPALVWMDARCTEQVSKAVAQLGRERIHQLSGKPPCTTPSLYKLMYLLEREPALRDGRVLDVHGFVAWRLTGRFATSLAAADPTGMIDMRDRSWSPALLDLAGLSAEQLPELLEPGTVIGALQDEAAAATGLPAGLAVVAGAGDGQSAGLGAGIVAPGRAYLNLGTAVVSGVLSHAYQTDDAFRTLYSASGEGYFLETDLQGGTFTLNWLVDRFGVDLAELEREAVRLPPGAEGLVLVPYWNGVMNPYWDDRASGMMIGLRGDHGPVHFYRAAVEGIALEQRLHTEGVEAATAAIDELVVMGGGSKSDLWCQILADTMNKPIVRAGTTEATALGAGILAGAAAGMFSSIAEGTAAMTSVGRRFEPGEGSAFYDKLYREVYSGLYSAVREQLRALWRLRCE
jgi:sugar (pentulose or hexulose) kinase